MKCNRAHWTSGLELLKHAVQTGSSVPGLETCLLESDSGTLTLTAANFQTEIRVQLPCDGDFESQAFNWKSLLQLSKAVKGRAGAIELVGHEAGMSLRIGKRLFKIDSQVARPPDPFLTMDESLKHSLEAFEADRFSRALQFVLRAVSKDESRVHLAQPCLLGDGRLAACDGHRLHIAEKIGGFTTGNNLLPIATRSGPAIVAAIKATGAVHVMGRAWVKSKIVEYSIAGAHLDVHIREKSVAADFPPVDSVIPNHDESYQLDRKLLIESLATLIKVHKATGVRHGQPAELLVNGKLTVGGHGFSESLELECQAPREQRIGVMADYMIDACAGDAETLEVFYGDELEAVITRPGEDLLGLVMPARLD